MSHTLTRIPVRRMDFAFPTDLPRYWFKGNSWLTHFMNGMSAVFPDGERFFIETVRNFQDQITDPHLQAQIRAFIGQEANHGKEHEAFNALLAEKHGLPLDRIVATLKRGLGFVRRRLSHKQQLAITIALEHFTAILANQLLEHPEIMVELDSACGDMFLWHAVEETEHKAVAFDVYQTTGGDYWTRVLAMARVTVMFTAHQLYFQLMLLRRDGKLTDYKSALGFLHYMLIDPGLALKIIPDYLAYYRRDFHPWQHDNRALINRYIESYRDKELHVA